MAVFAVYVLLFCAAGFAQSLEVASVKPSPPDSRVRAMAIHHETKDLQGFELVAARSGPKMKPAAIAGSQPAVELAAPPKTDLEGYPRFDGPGLVLMEGVRGKAVLVFVTAKAHRQIRLPPGPNLTTAVQQQLGLRLNPRKVPVDMVVVDRADQVPVGN
jgi:hypothetical protein